MSSAPNMPRSFDMPSSPDRAKRSSAAPEKILSESSVEKTKASLEKKLADAQADYAKARFVNAVPIEEFAKTIDADYVPKWYDALTGKLDLIDAAKRWKEVQFALSNLAKSTTEKTGEFKRLDATAAEELLNQQPVINESDRPVKESNVDTSFDLAPKELAKLTETILKNIKEAYPAGYNFENPILNTLVTTNDLSTATEYDLHEAAQEIRQALKDKNGFFATGFTPEQLARINNGLTLVSATEKTITEQREDTPQVKAMEFVKSVERKLTDLTDNATELKDQILKRLDIVANSDYSSKELALEYSDMLAHLEHDIADAEFSIEQLPNSVASHKSELLKRVKAAENARNTAQQRHMGSSWFRTGGVYAGARSAAFSNPRGSSSLEIGKGFPTASGASAPIERKILPRTSREMSVEQLLENQLLETRNIPAKSAFLLRELNRVIKNPNAPFDVEFFRKRIGMLREDLENVNVGGGLDNDPAYKEQRAALLEIERLYNQEREGHIVELTDAEKAKGDRVDFYKYMSLVMDLQAEFNHLFPDEDFKQIVGSKSNREIFYIDHGLNEAQIDAFEGEFKRIEDAAKKLNLSIPTGRPRESKTGAYSALPTGRSFDDGFTYDANNPSGRANRIKSRVEADRQNEEAVERSFFGSQYEALKNNEYYGTQKVEQGKNKINILKDELSPETRQEQTNELSKLRNALVNLGNRLETRRDLQDLAINLSRIEQRLEKGGHRAEFEKELKELEQLLAQKQEELEPQNASLKEKDPVRYADFEKKIASYHKSLDKIDVSSKYAKNRLEDISKALELNLKYLNQDGYKRAYLPETLKVEEHIANKLAEINDYELRPEALTSLQVNEANIHRAPEAKHKEIVSKFNFYQRQLEKIDPRNPAAGQQLDDTYNAAKMFLDSLDRDNLQLAYRNEGQNLYNLKLRKSSEISAANLEDSKGSISETKPAIKREEYLKDFRNYKNTIDLIDLSAPDAKHRLDDTANAFKTFQKRIEREGSRLESYQSERFQIEHQLERAYGTLKIEELKQTDPDTYKSYEAMLRNTERLANRIDLSADTQAGQKLKDLEKSLDATRQRLEKNGHLDAYKARLNELYQLLGEKQMRFQHPETEVVDVSEFAALEKDPVAAIDAQLKSFRSRIETKAPAGVKADVVIRDLLKLRDRMDAWKAGLSLSEAQENEWQALDQRIEQKLDTLEVDREAEELSQHLVEEKAQPPAVKLKHFQDLSRLAVEDTQEAIFDLDVVAQLDKLTNQLNQIKPNQERTAANLEALITKFNSYKAKLEKNNQLEAHAKEVESLAAAIEKKRDLINVDTLKRVERQYLNERQSLLETDEDGNVRVKSDIDNVTITPRDTINQQGERFKAIDQRFENADLAWKVVYNRLEGAEGWESRNEKPLRLINPAIGQEIGKEYKRFLKVMGGNTYVAATEFILLLAEQLLKANSNEKDVKEINAFVAEAQKILGKKAFNAAKKLLLPNTELTPAEKEEEAEEEAEQAQVA